MKLGIFVLACFVATASAAVYEQDVIVKTPMSVPMTVDQHFFDFVLRHVWQPFNVKEYKEFFLKPVLDETKYVVSISTPKDMEVILT